MVESGKFHISWRDRLSLVCLACSFPVQRLGAGASQPADTVIVNARIYTVNAEQPWAKRSPFGGDKILAVGSAKEIAALSRTFDQSDRRQADAWFFPDSPTATFISWKARSV